MNVRWLMIVRIDHHAIGGEAVDRWHVVCPIFGNQLIIIYYYRYQLVAASRNEAANIKFIIPEPKPFGIFLTSSIIRVHRNKGT